jgi:hypothetical protein
MANTNLSLSILVIFFNKCGSIVAFKLGRGVFLQLPLGNSANAAHPLEPFVPEPARGTAVSGIIDDEGFIAMSCDLGLISYSRDRFDTMQDTRSRRPEFYFVDQPKQLDPFAIISFGRFRCFFFSRHS